MVLRQERGVVRTRVVVDCYAHLLEVVAARHAGGGFPHLLHRGQQKTDENGDNRDHHQQLNEGEAGPQSRAARGTKRHVANS